MAMRSPRIAALLVFAGSSLTVGTASRIGVGPQVVVAQARVAEWQTARALIDATGFEGSILVSDPIEKHYQAGYAERVDIRLAPASTFKILNSLIALETGVVADGETVIEWDGTQRQRIELNKDLDLTTAFRLSAVPHFQELTRRIGLERMQQYVDAVGYGNRDISGGIDRFWLVGGLRISPREQVDFLARLYRDDLPFSAKSMAVVREMMLIEQTQGYELRAKTGWAQLPNDENVGWWVGWVEDGSRVHFFATTLQTQRPGETFGTARLSVTREVLQKLGVLPAN